jgi:3-isopropylmalate/(R)-2-methylmalate dehydratase large subunit
MGRTIAQKILEAHAVEGGPVEPGAIVQARLDRVLLNDISGPMAFAQFERMGGRRVADPEKVVLVCDHFVPPSTLAAARALREMRAFARSQGISAFYDVGQGGIEHTLLPERGLVSPGALIIGGDSHTCTYGAFNAFGTGLGSTDIAAALALGSLWFMVPHSARVEVHGRPRPCVTGKDVILHLLGRIGTDGATYQSLEFDGEGLAHLNVDERMAICNMAVEGGAKTGIMAFDAVTAEWARAVLPHPPQPVAPDPDARYTATYRIDLTSLEPLVAQPHSPAAVAPVTEAAGVRVDQVYIGNCANGTLTDLRQAALVLRGRRIAPRTRAIVVPATQRIYREALAEGLIDTFLEAGAVVSPPTCGACFGGHMGLLDDGEVAVATTNRNYRGRMGHAGARIYLANAYVAAAAAVAGELIDPRHVVGPEARP